MKLIWKGKYQDENVLKRGSLPANAVQFVEPDTPSQLGRAALPFLLPPFCFWILVICIKILYWKELPILFHILGVPLSLLFILPHELLHAIAFPKGAEAEIWHAVNQGIAFVYSNAPMTKRRFIFLSLLPNLAFGVLPLAVWVFIPPDTIWSGIISALAITNLLMGAGDYMNAYNAAKQVPRGALTRLYGFHSYWYLPSK